MQWKIYYADGSTFSSADGAPEDAPPVGVIAIKFRQLHGEWGICAFSDYYFWVDGEWWKADVSGFWQHMFKPGAKVVKFGTTLPNFEFQKIMTIARNDDLGEGSVIT